VALTDAGLGFEGSLAIKARHGQPGQVRPFREMSDRVVWNHEHQQMARRRIVADAETDHYMQEWKSLDTGEVLFRKEGQLSDPEMHGQSARRPR
jgi:hypothetical protein